MILLFNVVSSKLVFTMSEQEISGPVDAIHTGLGADHPTHFSLIGTISDDEGRGLALSPELSTETSSSMKSSVMIRNVQSTMQ